MPIETKVPAQPPRTLEAWVKLLESVRIPVPKQSYDRVLAAINDSRRSLRDIAELMQDSPALVLSVMRETKVAANAPNIDVTRITAQVVMGVGFLGAGVIFREGSNVHGLNSAATIWCSAAIGCIAASGYFIEALICTFLVITVNTVLEPVERWMRNRK